MKLTARLSGYKTLVVSSLVTTGGVVAAIPDQLQQLGIRWIDLMPQVVPTKIVGHVLIGLGLIFSVLRLVTRTPPFQTTPQYPQVPPDLMQYAPGSIRPDPNIQPSGT